MYFILNTLSNFSSENEELIKLILNKWEIINENLSHFFL